MPALDLPRLQRQTAALAPLLGQPRALRTVLRQILDETSNRAYRPGVELMSARPQHSYQTPPVVLRAIRAALYDAAVAAPEAALAAADRLWTTPIFEEQLVAAQLLGMAAPALPGEALKRLEAWLPGANYQQLSDGLAREGCAPLVRLNPGRYLEVVRGWAESPEKWTRRFALAAVLPLAEDRSADVTPGALNVLRAVMADPEPEVRKVAALVLRALAERSPAEVRRFLRDHARGGARATARLIEQVLPALDQQSREALAALLRGGS